MLSYKADGKGAPLYLAEENLLDVRFSMERTSNRPLSVSGHAARFALRDTGCYNKDA